MPRLEPSPRQSRNAFTLIEMLVVISIISLLISILLPSLSRAREQAKKVRCLATLHEFGTGLASYENMGPLPPALWYPDLEKLEEGAEPDHEVAYGWMEILYTVAYREEVRLPVDYPVQRHIEGHRWGEYFLCQAVGDEGVNSGHYRVYLPAWAAGTYALDPDGRYGENTQACPLRVAHRENIRPKLPLIGDANDMSERGDGLGNDDCSYIDAGEANYAGSDGQSRGNRFSDRHHGGTNYLFADFHAAWSTRLREDLARDYDLNGVDDIDVDP